MRSVAPAGRRQTIQKSDWSEMGVLMECRARVARCAAAMPSLSVDDGRRLLRGEEECRRRGEPQAPGRPCEAILNEAWLEANQHARSRARTTDRWARPISTRTPSQPGADANDAAGEHDGAADDGRSAGKLQLTALSLSVQEVFANTSIGRPR